MLKFLDDKTATRPQLLLDVYENLDILQLINHRLEFILIPGHHDIPGNDVADCAAKKSLQSPTVQLDVDFELQAAKESMKNHVNNIWQREWNDGETGSSADGQQYDQVLREIAS